MKPSILYKLARKIRLPFVRKRLLRKLFKRHGLKLQDIYTFNDDQFYIYKVNDFFIPNEMLVEEISYQSQFEKCRNESLFAYTPARGDTILDIGAGLGEETIYYSHLVGEPGQVYALEANPKVFEVLKKTIELNKLSNVSPDNVAIFSENGRVKLAGDQHSYEAIYVTEPDSSSPSIPAVRLDHFIAEKRIKKIDLLKINIEGAERFIVDTLQPAQLLAIRHVAIACHDFRFHREGNAFFKTKELIIRFLQQNGFEIQIRNTETDYINDWVYGINKFT